MILVTDSDSLERKTVTKIYDREPKGQPASNFLVGQFYRIIKEPYHHMWRYGAGFGIVKRFYSAKILHEMTFHEDFYGSRSFRGLFHEKRPVARASARSSAR